MENLERHAGTLDASNPESVAAFAGHLGMVDEILEAHSQEEERVLWPEIVTRLPGVMGSYEIDHREERSLFERIRTDVAKLSGTGSDNGSVQARLTRSVAVASEHLKLHMLKEEEDVYSKFAETLSDTEGKDLIGRILSGLPPEMLPSAMPWLASHLSADEVAESFSLYVEALGPERARPYITPLPTGMPPEKWQEVVQKAPELGAYA